MSFKNTNEDVAIAIATGGKTNNNGYGAVGSTITQDDWDFVMVFPNPPKDDPDPEDQRDNIILKLRAAGLETKLFFSTTRDLVFCKLRASEERMQVVAEKMKLRMLLDAKDLKATAQRGIPEANIKPFRLRDVKNTLPYNPYEFIYAAYTRKPEVQYFYEVKGPNGSLFNKTERMVLIEHMITDPVHGAGCDLERLLYEGVIAECFPLHENDVKERLAEKWIRWTNAPMNQPFEEVWDYFGVKVALYFLFLGHSTKWLTYPAVVGLIPFVLNFTIWDPEQHRRVFSYVSPIFGALFTIWMTVYLNNWKRANSRACLRWGTTDYETHEHLRPQFVGEIIPSPINGKPTRWFSPREKRRRVALSWLVTSVFMLLVVAIVLAIFYLRYDLTHGADARDLTIHVKGHEVQLGPMISAFANVAQITIMGKIFYYISIYLNNNENHRTDIDYENSLILKSVMFQFVNNFAALFYVAFVKDDLEGCQHSCMWELRYTYLIVFVSRLITSNITEVAIPRAWTYIDRFRLTGSFFVRDERLELMQSAAERELFLSNYDWLGTFNDYLEIVIQFGFTSMFAVAFPLSGLFSYVTNYFEIRLDAYRILYECRRPRPQKVKDIGYWYPILQIFAGISICTNGGVIIFTGAYFTGISTVMRVWFFTLFVGSMFLLKFVLESNIDSTPEGVTAQHRRQAFLVGKCLYHIPDEDRRRTPDALRKDLSNIEEVLAIAEHDDDE
jgi:hypothetical protein